MRLMKTEKENDDDKIERKTKTHQRIFIWEKEMSERATKATLTQRRRHYAPHIAQLGEKLIQMAGKRNGGRV